MNRGRRFLCPHLERGNISYTGKQICDIETGYQGKKNVKKLSSISSDSWPRQATRRVYYDYMAVKNLEISRQQDSRHLQSCACDILNMG